VSQSILAPFLDPTQGLSGFQPELLVLGYQDAWTPNTPSCTTTAMVVLSAAMMAGSVTESPCR
jgi:hypothetical protein